MILNKATPHHKFYLALGTALLMTLSAAHHLLHFWELSLPKELFILSLGLAVFAFLIVALLKYIWIDLQQVERIRWLLFLLPACAIAAFTTWAIFKSPVVWHTLELTPELDSESAQIQLLEIKSSSGGVVKFTSIALTPGWTLDQGVLIAQGAGAEPIAVSFQGPLDRPVELTFAPMPIGGQVRIMLDGKASQFNLSDSGSQSVLHLNPSFRFGIPGTVFTFFLVLLDFSSLLIVLTLLWLVQELLQLRTPSLQSQPWDIRWSHKDLLLMLLSLSVLLHFINYFSTPLILDVDSPSYMDGVVYWLKYHNLGGVSAFRGPLTTIFFLLPAIFFGRNPWGTKALLHLVAIVIVLLSYWLGWKLSGRRWFSFLVGFLTVLTPDLYFYSNFIMSEIPNILFVLSFCVLLIYSIETLTPKWIFAALLAGSLTVLLRSENIILLYIGIAGMLAKASLEWWTTYPSVPDKKRSAAVMLRKLGWIVFSTLVAVAPIVGWSAHNYKQYGFFGLSNYAGEVLYTGWVYEGEASHIPITDKTSKAVQTLEQAFGEITGAEGNSRVPTGWKIYPSLIQRGYTSQQAFDLLKQAAIDSLKKDYRVTMDVLLVKIKDSFVPETIAMQTIALSSDSTAGQIKPMYFDEEKPVFPALTSIQREINQFVEWYFVHLYPAWVWFCAIATGYCFYRKPFWGWGLISLITITRIVLPQLIGLSHWRPMVSAIVLMQICGLALLHSLWLFTRKAARARGLIHAPVRSRPEIPSPDQNGFLSDTTTRSNHPAN